MTHTFKLARRIARLKWEVRRVGSVARALLPALHRPVGILAAAVLLALASACSDNNINDLTGPDSLLKRDGGPGRGNRRIVALVVSPDTARLSLSQSWQFSAEGRRSDGSRVEVSVQWSATGGSIDSTGKFTAGKAAGTYRVVATQSAGELTDTARVTLTQTGPTPGPTPTPKSLVLTPATVSTQPGAKAKFSATVKMSDSTTGNVAVSYSATGGSVDSTGTYTAGGTAGTYRVIASVGTTGPADTSTVTITSPKSLVLTPATVSLQPGAKTTFTATVKMSDSTTGNVAVAYSATGGSVDSTGTYTAGGTAGTYRVIASVGTTGPADTAAVTITSTSAPCTGSATVICPGDNWQAKVNAAGSGTIFTIKAGVHRLQSVVAKTSQQFVAEPGAIMSGAKLLTGWTQNGSTWWVGGQTQEFGHSTGVCQSGTACQYPEDVYRDDVLLKRELSLGAVGPGEFYFDYAADRIYVGDDPNGHKLEAAATEYAFMGSPDGSGTGVVIDGLTVEKYANAAQYGAIGRSNTQRGWVIRNATVRWNHGAGIRIGAIQVLGGRVHHNGQIGMVGGFDNTTLIRDVEVDHNNTAKFAADWEGGGIKFGGGYFTGAQVIRTNIHDNDGIGLWADGYCDQFVWDSNTVVNNTWDGIKVEISYGGKVRWNTVTGNGYANPNSDEGDGIMVYSSGGSGLEIAYNTLSGNKHAIMLFAADRGTGPAGPLVTKNVSVHDNTVTLSGSQRTGAVRYSGSTGLWTTDNNHFEGNTYRLQSASAAPFAWATNALLTDAQWRAAGNDETGSWSR